MQIHENCHQNKNNIEDGPLIQMSIETPCSDQLESIYLLEDLLVSLF